MGDVADGTRRSGELVERLADLTTGRGYTVACAESLTSGSIAARLGAGPNSSAWFRGGIVAYARSVKHGLLEVPDGPVVCEAAARAMADTTARLLDADLVVAVTGVGGPDPQDGRPPGTVCFATTGTGDTRYEEHHFDGDPEDVLAQTVRRALELLVERASA
ncbi:MAG: CinA family protein [Rhodococcus sp. (in: high G+C Gram-positive bacteria)]|uniref:CinA family protein n=1 Tax=Rhodococcus sp. TaxID=1831 RepID=UPI003BB7EA79